MNDREWCEALVRHIVTPGMRVLDVGANEGQYVHPCLQAGAEVWAIEPSAASCAILAQRCPQAHVRQWAIGDYCAEAVPFWHSHTDSRHHSRYRAALPYPHLGMEQTVPLRTLDDLMACGDLPSSFDLVKVDVQGAEAALLAGASRLLASEAAWMLELWPYGVQCAGDTLESCYVRLAGYAPWNVQRGVLVPWTWDQVREAAARQEPQSALNLFFAKAQSPIGHRLASLDEVTV